MQGQQPARPVLVYYHIPEDKDEADIPNAFPVLKPGGDVRLQDIRAKFPLPGKYHFRFKMRLGDSAAALWMDVTNEDMQVPMFDGKIVAKVIRLSWGTGVGPAPPARSPTPAAEAPAAPSPQARMQAPAELLGFDGQPPPPAAAAQPRAAWPAQGDMLQTNVQQPPPPPPPQAQSKNSDFDMLFG
mmetsp:Transcript_12401/g.25711  ORF Transcript_12401/g.25711 Transcript_12401/m.25711 type:complete len:185 (-) Transcript_12401:58-612(-)